MPARCQGSRQWRASWATATRPPSSAGIDARRHQPWLLAALPGSSYTLKQSPHLADGHLVDVGQVLGILKLVGIRRPHVGIVMRLGCSRRCQRGAGRRRGGSGSSCGGSRLLCCTPCLLLLGCQLGRHLGLTHLRAGPDRQSICAWHGVGDHSQCGPQACTAVASLQISLVPSRCLVPTPPACAAAAAPAGAPPPACPAAAPPSRWPAPGGREGRAGRGLEGTWSHVQHTGHIAAPTSRWTPACRDPAQIPTPSNSKAKAST